MSDYKKLKVWKYSHQLAIDIYKITNDFPEEEKFGIISQLRRAACSIPTNIAEGCGQLDNGNLVRFLGIAKGSAFETEYQLLLSRDLSFITKEQYNLIDEKIKYIIRMLTQLINSLKSFDNNK